MNQRLVQYNPELEGVSAFQAGPLAAVAPGRGSNAGVFNEGQLLELAAELLEGHSPAALDQTLGRLIRLASRALATGLSPAVALALQRSLRNIAQPALPMPGRLQLGGGADHAADPAAAPGAADSVARATRLFGLELEGLSPEDKEFELAKSLVRLVGDAVRHATRLPPMASPLRLATRAVAHAARHVAPGLLPGRDLNVQQALDPPGEPLSVRDFTATHHSQEPTMHDIDRTQMEYSNEQFEFGEGEWSGEAGGSFSEAEEMELATELLSVSNEGELDRFLGDLVSRATQAVGSFVRSPIGQAVGGVLKGVAKKALPMAGSAIGGYFGGPLGARIGSGLANAAGNALGLEGEMAGEDREFEGAKQFVRLAAQTAAQAAAAPLGADPRAVAQQAAMAAARQHAPGLLAGGGMGGGAPAAAGQAPAAGGGVRSGRWLRRGNKIVLYGA